MKKTVILSTILLCSLAITSVVLAEQLKVEPVTERECFWGIGEGCIISRPIPPTPPRQPYDVQMAYGIAVDRNYLTTEPVLFVIFKYDWNTKMYLILNGEFYRMEQIESKYDWNTNTRMFKYRDNYRNVMILTAQEFSDGVSISAVYKNYIITFEPIRYGIVHPEPVIRETQIMPVFSQLTQSTGIKAGVNAETLLSQAKPIAEWSEKGN